MFNSHSKFEVSTIICNEEMKGNSKCKWPKCKILRFKPPFGDLEERHMVYLSLDGKRIVDFQLAIIEFVR